MNSKKKYSNNDEVSTYLETGSQESVSIKQLQQLVRLLDESDVSEIEVKRNNAGMRLVLRKAVANQPGDNNGVAYPAVLAASESAEQATESAQIEARHAVTAPLVGIFHTWAKPKGKPLVQVGDRISIGQLVGTIQSLNVINEVESLVAGRITEIFVQDGQPVEYGQQLMMVNSSEED